MKTLVTRYPESPYARQAENRIRIAEDSIAASEMHIGRYYLKKGNHLGAINRFKVVVSDHQTTQHVEEALMRLTETYMALGVVPEAQAAAAVLGHNYPQSKWYQSSYALLQEARFEAAGEFRQLDQPATEEDLPERDAGEAAAEGADAGAGTVGACDPPARQPAQDVPTASTTKSGSPMGLVRHKLSPDTEVCMNWSPVAAVLRWRGIVRGHAETGGNRDVRPPCWRKLVSMPGRRLSRHA